MPIQVPKPVVRCFSSLVGYGPQEGLPALPGHSYRAGCLCRLRCPVAPFAQVGSAVAELPCATMERSDSRHSFGRSFLSLDRPSRLALAVSAAGDCRASALPNGVLFTRHALRPRQVGQRLTTDGSVRIEFR